MCWLKINVCVMWCKSVFIWYWNKLSWVFNWVKLELWLKNILRLIIKIICVLNFLLCVIIVVMVLVLSFMKSYKWCIIKIVIVLCCVKGWFLLLSLWLMLVNLVVVLMMKIVGWFILLMVKNLFSGNIWFWLL